MPQGPSRLRQKFMLAAVDDPNGIRRCEQIIREAGGMVHRGVISFAKDIILTGDLKDAIDYLCLEWDYAYDLSTKGKVPMKAYTGKLPTVTLGDPSNGTCLEGYEHIDYKPLWDFILAKPVKRSETKGGIALPDNAKLDDTGRCLVIKAGPGFYQNGVFIPNPIKVGQYIFNMAKHLQPYKVMLGTELYLSMASSEVLAVASTSGLDESAEDWNQK